MHWSSKETEIVWQCLIASQENLRLIRTVTRHCPSPQVARQELQRAVFQPFQRDRKHPAGSHQALSEDLVQHALTRVDWQQLLEAIAQLGEG